MRSVANKPHIPSSPYEVSPRWVTSVLHDQGALPSDQRVTGLDVSALGGGLGLAGEVVRVNLRYSDANSDAPDSVVAKFPNPDPVDRAIIESQGVYEREILFYREIAPRLPFAIPKLFGAAMDSGPSHALVSKAAIGIDKLPVRAHLAIGRNPDKFLRPTKRRYALLIEDLGDNRQVFTLADPPPVEKLKLALTKLALLHAHMWGQDDLASHAACWPIVSETPMLQRNLYVDLADVAAQRYELFDESVRALCNEAGDRFPTDVSRLNRPITLTHSDPRSDNFLFDRTSDDVAIVDWAMPGFADPGYDVGYLLSSSLDTSHGRSVARSLTEHYHRELESLNVSYPLEEIWQSVEATARAMVVQQTLSLSMFSASNLTDGHPTDHWLPRALAVLQ